MDQQSLLQQFMSLLTFSASEISLIDSAESTRVAITLPQEESGMLIGYHGETIDSLQLIISLMLNHGKSEYKPVEVDINGYRQGRQTAIEDLAEKAAEKALESGREIILPPLSSRERRLVHVYLSTRSDVNTYSEGEGSARRLVVRPVAVA